MTWLRAVNDALLAFVAIAWMVAFAILFLDLAVCAAANGPCAVAAARIAGLVAATIGWSWLALRGRRNGAPKI